MNSSDTASKAAHKLSVRRIVEIAILSEKPKRYALIAYVIAIVPVLILGLLLNWIGIESHHSETKTVGQKWLFIVASLAVAPVIETFLMIPVFGLLRLVANNKGWLCFGSALIWATIHSSFDWRWGITVFWLFVVYSFSYLTWEKRSRNFAVAITASIHALVNTIPALVIVFG